MIKAKDLRNKKIEDLKKMLLDEKKKLESCMNDVYKGKEKNLHKAYFIRKDIARIATVIQERNFMEGENNA